MFSSGCINGETAGKGKSGRIIPNEGLAPYAPETCSKGDGARGGQLHDGGTKPVHVESSWKRRARSSHNRQSDATKPALHGKRMISGDKKGVEDEALSSTYRRTQQKRVNTLELHDEMEDQINGSGMAGTGSQPRRLV